MATLDLGYISSYELIKCGPIFDRNKPVAYFQANPHYIVITTWIYQSVCSLRLITSGNALPRLGLPIHNLIPIEVNTRKS